MRKLIVLSFITLDGVIQAPGGPNEDISGGFKFGGWVVPYFDEESNILMNEQMNYHADLLLGRITFEIFASYWPHHEEDWPGINNVTKYVVSNSLSHHNWKNTIFLKGNIESEIKKIKAKEGPDIQVHGSSNLIQTLLKYDLVDEFWLKIFPITLGSGKRLFEKGTIPRAFKLVHYSVTPKGVIFCFYKREGEITVGSFEESK